ANEPMLRVRAPIIEGHLLETPLLTLSNFPTLCATKASRVVASANGRPCFEQGLRRAQGIDGALTASWASFVGGFKGTSNLAAMELYGIPSGGTMAHALVMSFEEELAAFDAYAEALPNNCVFLVDTYNSIEGIKKAIKVGHKLRARGYEMLGIRLDSGDLAQLSIQARRMLDEAGFPNAKIFVSNDLDEYIISSLNTQGARICVYGVGTKVVTCFDQPALGAVYKLGAILDKTSGKWRYPIKVSEQAAKTSTPGVQQVKRFSDRSGRFLGDMIYNELSPAKRVQVMVDPFNDTRGDRFLEGRDFARAVDMLQPIFRQGECVYKSPNIFEIQSYAQSQLQALPEAVRRFENPHEYPVRMEKGLYNLRRKLIKKARAA
ncbi:MAG: nicotinate phosphoribosyltransferase, partial [Candidatus Obscuribacterales bacterium]|nr:nicotinate phosphoribosyltransferase [Candidatus Obscuribacterales bacterium]